MIHISFSYISHSRLCDSIYQFHVGVLYVCVGKPLPMILQWQKRKEKKNTNNINIWIPLTSSPSFIHWRDKNSKWMEFVFYLFWTGKDKANESTPAWICTHTHTLRTTTKLFHYTIVPLSLSPRRRRRWRYAQNQQMSERFTQTAYSTGDNSIQVIISKGNHNQWRWPLS